MKWAYQIKYKVRAASFLAVLIVVILLSNFSKRHNFENLDRSVATVVDDRLMPATYLFEISNALYKKRMLHEGSNTYSATDKAYLINVQNVRIEAYIKKYESTVLTNDEKIQWLSFKQDLGSYNAMEIAWLGDMQKTSKDVMVTDIGQINVSFDKIINDLDQLTNIQVGEGSNIKKKTASIIGFAELLGHLEFAAVIILSLFTIVILSISDKALFRGQKQQALN